MPYNNSAQLTSYLQNIKTKLIVYTLYFILCIYYAKIFYDKPGTNLPKLPIISSIPDLLSAALAVGLVTLAPADSAGVARSSSFKRGVVVASGPKTAA